MVATLIRVTGDRDLAEESAQEAFAQALLRWPRDGIPRRPGAWLTTAARNRAVDTLRRRTVGAAELREVAALSHEPESGDESGVPDDRLRLTFTCCHPALALEARVALTLRTLAGRARTRCRPPSRPATWRRPILRTPTGRRSPRSTGGWRT
ncbi:sigma factor [Streptosporangium sp. NPDC050855]|uniref:sigma factor n=1 Tax=Streptosporangium sp. NPDC050855 TaxID=3366194 RepID=UPI0037A43C16